MSPSPASHSGKATSAHPDGCPSAANASKDLNRKHLGSTAQLKNAQSPSPLLGTASVPAANPAALGSTEATTATVSQRSLPNHAKQKAQDAELQSTAQTTPTKQLAAAAQPTSAPAIVQQSSSQQVAGSTAAQPLAAQVAEQAISTAAAASSDQALDPDICMTEVIPVPTDDRLPLSYPATLVATLPCTVPSWLAPTQIAAPTSSANASFLETQILCATKAYAKSFLGAEADSRATTAAVTHEHYAGQLDGSQTSPTQPTKVVLAAEGLQAQPGSSNMQHPEQATGTSSQSPSKRHGWHAKLARGAQQREGGKRPAEEDVEYAAKHAGSTYKRARSDSPIAAHRHGGKLDSRASYQAPSDADVQVSLFLQI